MSDARKCDKCGELFEPKFGDVSLDISVKGKAEAYHTWSDVDLCAACSVGLLDVLSNALRGLHRPRVLWDFRSYNPLLRSACSSTRPGMQRRNMRLATMNVAGRAT